LTDKLEIHFIQIPKFKKEENGMKTKLQQWMQFICQTNPKGVELAMKENKEIRRAKEEYEFLTGKEAERRIAFLRDKAIKDENNIRKREKEKGRKEGERKKQIEIAKELLKLGIKIEDIEKATKLTKEEIQKL
jgi:predicted transposase/invertase (TIGR01784 family)